MELERLSYLGPFRISCFDVIIEGKQCKLTTGIVIDRYKFLAFINNLASFFFALVFPICLRRLLFFNKNK